MVASIANQEAIECSICQVDSAHKALTVPATPRLCISPASHHSIAKHADIFYDLTAWLSEHWDDPATTVCHTFYIMIVNC